ncbi:EstA protein [Coprinopsis cinerea okayama7|uniref:Carboxylic ester hydrolase n=1 Tax=Coprinopsis cinerea (strain Okayama-7 / 130 / ATCC MYA-4618 / FGSC 9003) TaxID=240176 RepID=A8NUU9_COPC7|nr:EstA protein [Coprinopsis cinerea okayama7\|eukprot:XP_001836539.2 EstA protein [Coprinopsis cinerea okayama7\
MTALNTRNLESVHLKKASSSKPTPRTQARSSLMWFAAFTVLLAGVWYGSVLAAPSELSSGRGDVVDTGYARYRGNRAYHNTVAYLGIPYAEPPLGERRFRAPLPLNTTRIRLQSRGEIVDATEYPDFCIQGTTGGGDAGGAGSEDCLKVNIYAPAGATRRSNRYIYGNPANWPFEHWINQNPNVVIVSVYYRLSSFGFLSIPELRDSTNGDLNAGFLDQIEALKWVKRNIRHFGGNPNRVTINGESAGGSSVELHLVADAGERLFSGAIAQSVYRTPLPSPEQQVPLFNYYATTAGCGEGTVAEKLACLRKAPVSALARAQDTARPPTFSDETSSVESGYFQFHPVVDGKVIKDYPTRLITQGKFARVPLIVGATSNETLGGGEVIRDVLKRFFPSISDADVGALEAAYDPEDFATPNLRLQALVGDSQLICARSIMGTAFSQRGLDTYTYRYNQRNPTNGGTGVWHAAENWMMFRGTNTGLNGTTTFTELNETEQNFASELIAYWLSFVRTGNPNTHKLARSPRWAPYRIGSRARIVLQQVQDTAQAGSGESPERAAGAASEGRKGSGSHMENETVKETGRCVIVANQVERQQN